MSAPRAPDLRNQWLAEAGIVRWRPRPALAPPAREPLPTRFAATPAQQPSVAVPAAVVSPAAVPAAGYGSTTLRFHAASGLDQLRRHLLQALAGSVVESGDADVVFGGKGAGLSFPALGALAATPALKRQVWMAWRAWRRARRA